MPESELITSTISWMTTYGWGLMTGLVVIVVGWFLSKVAARGVRRVLPHASAIDKTIAPLLSQTVRYGILIVALVIALNEFGVETNSILAVLGAAGLAIALALQGTLSNVAAGVMLVWLRPMSIGEYIAGNGIAGTVLEMGLFSTRLRTADGLFVMIPNSQLWDSAITNYSRQPRRRIDLKVGIAYDADIAKARKALIKIANADKRVLPDPVAAVHVEALGDSAVVMLLRIWVPTPDYWDVLFEFNERTKLAFDKEGIEIPYNKLDVNLSRSEAEE